MILEEKIKLYESLIQEDRLRMPPKMRAFQQPKRYKFAHGGRGGGKTDSALKIVLEHGNREKIKVLCTREIQRSIKDSVYSALKKWIEELKYTEYEITQNEIRHARTSSVFIFTGLQHQETKQTIKSYDDVDICIVEEAQTVSAGSIKILDPTIRKNNSEVWFLFNRLIPDDPVWSFMERIPEFHKTVVNINYYDNPYLPETLKVVAERSKQEYEQGLNNDYLHTWEGEPFGYSNKAIFTVEEIYNAIKRKASQEGSISVGVDVARFGSDLTTLYKRKGMQVTNHKRYAKNSIDECVDFTKTFVNQDKTVAIKTDDSGVGGGVTDYLKKAGYNVIGINNGTAAEEKDKYNNRISEMWFYLKSIINEVGLPDIPTLKTQLLTREYKYDSKERRCIESKEEYKKRTKLKSPDEADGLLLCFVNPSVSYRVRWL